MREGPNARKNLWVNDRKKNQPKVKFYKEAIAIHLNEAIFRFFYNETLEI